MLDLSTKRRPSQPIASHKLSSQDLVDVMSLLDPFGVWRLDLASWTLMLSADVFRIHGLEVRDGPIQMKEAIGLYHPDDRDYLLQLIADIVEKKGGFRYVLRISDRQSRYKLVKCTGMLRKGPQGSDEIFGTFCELPPLNRSIGTAFFEGS